MSIQLLITMRQELARRFAKDRTASDVLSIIGDFTTARLVGAPGFSMRILVDETEAAELERVLDATYVVEPDYAFETFKEPSYVARRASVAGQTSR